MVNIALRRSYDQDSVSSVRCKYLIITSQCKSAVPREGSKPYFEFYRAAYMAGILASNLPTTTALSSQAMLCP